MGVEVEVPAKKRDDDQRIATIGQRVREAREALPMTQTALAALIDIDESSVRAIESGRRGVSMEMLFKLSGALGVPPSVLIGEASATAVAASVAAGIVDELSPSDQQLALRLLRSVREHANGAKVASKRSPRSRV